MNLKYEYASWQDRDYTAHIIHRIPSSTLSNQAYHQQYIRQILTPMQNFLNTRLKAVSVVVGDTPRHIHSLLCNPEADMEQLNYYCQNQLDPLQTLVRPIHDNAVPYVFGNYIYNHAATLHMYNLR
jgi:hypothetical protein